MVAGRPIGWKSAQSVTKVKIAYNFHVLLNSIRYDIPVTPEGLLVQLSKPKTPLTATPDAFYHLQQSQIKN